MASDPRIITDQQITDTAVDFLGSGSYFQATAYDTHLLISEWENYDIFHKFELFDRKILWINQILQEHRGEEKLMMARTIMPCNEQDFDGHIVVNRLASVLCYTCSSAYIDPRVSAGTAFPVPSVAQPAQMMTGLLVDHEQLDLSINAMQLESFTDKKWIALAHYRQAILSQTPYYQVLSYWKILELYFNNNGSRMNSHINDAHLSRPDIFCDLPAFTTTASRKLRDIRNLSAHFKLDDGDIQDPDNPDVFLIADQATYVLKRIARDLIDLQNGW